MTAVGPQGIVTARSKNVTKDELFIFDPNHAQISLIGHNGKLVSVKQGSSIFFIFKIYFHFEFYFVPYLYRSLTFFVYRFEHIVNRRILIL